MNRFNDLIGIPFVDGGRTPKVDGGLDCWGLFILAMRRFGREVPDYKIGCFNTPQISAQVADALAKQWREVKEPMPGCGVTMSIDPYMPGVVQHLGVHIGDGQILHTLEKTGSILSSVHDRYWGRKITGFWEWIG